jgi:hypothetical protein
MSFQPITFDQGSLPSVNPVDPAALAALQGALALETQTAGDQLATLNAQSAIESLNTQASIRQQIMAAMEAIANQAKSLSQQFIGDEISEAKKGVENAGKAV